MVAEEFGHLRLALEILLLGVAQAVWRIVELVGHQADETVVRGAVLRRHEVDVVGCDDFDAEFGSQLKDLLVDHLLLDEDALVAAGNLGLVAHHLQVIILSEEVAVPGNQLLRLLEILGVDGAGHLSRQAGAAADKAFVIFLQQVVVDTGLVIEALDKRKRA